MTHSFNLFLVSLVWLMHAWIAASVQEILTGDRTRPTLENPVDEVDDVGDIDETITVRVTATSRPGCRLRSTVKDKLNEVNRVSDSLDPIAICVAGTALNTGHADVTDAIRVGVFLTGMVNRRAVVDIATDAVAIDIIIDAEWTRITGIALAVVVAVQLIDILHCDAIVARVA